MCELHNLLEQSAGLHLATGCWGDVSNTAMWVRQLTVGVDSQQLIDTGGQIPRIDRAIAHRFTATITRTDDLPACKSATCDDGIKAGAEMLADNKPAVISANNFFFIVSPILALEDGSLATTLS